MFGFAAEPRMSRAVPDQSPTVDIVVTGALAAEPRRVTVAPLPGRWRDLLRDGNQDDYATDHGACLAVAVAMYRAGHSERDFVREMSEPGNRLAEHYRLKDPERGRKLRRHRGPAAAAVKMRRDWAKAVARALENPQVHDRSEARQQLGVFHAAVLAAAWLGVRRRDLLEVLLQLIAIGMEQGSMNPTISTRTLAQLLDCDSSTISRRLHKLQLLGWLIRVTSDDPTMPHTYRLVIPPTTRDSDFSTVQNCNTSLALPRGDRGVAVLDTPSPVELSVDADVRAVCGTASALVVAAVAAGARGVTEIRRLTGLARQTVYTQLARLAKMALVARDAAGSWVRTARSVAVELRAEAQVKRVRRAERHAAQRATWQDRLLHMPWTVFGRAAAGRRPQFGTREIRT